MQTQTPTPIQIKNRSLIAPAAGALVFVACSAANAAIDVSDATGEIAGMGAPVAAIGGAILLILVAIKAWKMIRRAM